MKFNFRIEFILALMFITSFFMPWVDMGILVKVVGWDIPYVQSSISEMSKEFTESPSANNYLYAIYIIPFFALITAIFSLLNKTKTARYILAILSVLGLAISIALYVNLPNLGSGVYTLFGLSLLSIFYLLALMLIRKLA